MTLLTYSPRLTLPALYECAIPPDHGLELANCQNALQLGSSEWYAVRTISETAVDLVSASELPPAIPWPKSLDGLYECLALIRLTDLLRDSPAISTGHPAPGQPPRRI